MLEMFKWERRDVEYKDENKKVQNSENYRVVKKKIVKKRKRNIEDL